MPKCKSNLQYRELSYILLLFLAALSAHLIRLLYWTPYPDELSYAQVAKHLLGSATVISKAPSPYFYRVLFVYLSSILQWAGFSLLLSVRFLAAFFGAGILPISYFILSKFYQKKLAFICSLSLLFLYPLNMYSRLGYVETMHIFFSLLAFFFLLPGSLRGTKRSLLIAGFFLGIAIWAKEAAIMGLLAAIIYLFLVRLLFRERVSVYDYLAFAGGLFLPLVTQFVISQISGYSLLYEMFDRPYNVNDLSLGMMQSITHTGARLIKMFGVPYGLGYFVGVPLVFICGSLLLRGLYLRKHLALLSVSYLVVALSFFIGYNMKFSYYLLSSALLLFIFGFCEVGDYFKKVIESKSSRTTLLHSLLVPKRSFFHLLYLVGGVLLVTTVLVNIPYNSKLYFTRGGHENFRSVLFQFNPGDAIATSHSNIFQYVNEEENLNLTILRLLMDPNYQLNWKAISDDATTAIITKDYYFDRLSARDKSGWSELKRLFPVTINYKGLVVLRRNNTDSK